MALITLKTPYTPQELVDNINSNISELDNEKVDSSELLSYQEKITASGLLKGNGSGGISAAVAGTDYYNAATIPSASTEQKGIVQLDDSVSSAATDKAATANAVKQAYDKASAALPKAGGTMSGAIAMGDNKITGLGAPTVNGDAATKQYVDNLVGNIEGYDILGGTSAVAVAADFDASTGEPLAAGDTKARTAITAWLTANSKTAGTRDALYVTFNLTGVEEKRTWLYAYSGSAWNHVFSSSEITMADGAKAGIVESGGDLDFAAGAGSVKTGVITDAKIGSREVDDPQTTGSETHSNTLTNLLNRIVGVIRGFRSGTYTVNKATKVDGIDAAGNNKYYGTNASGAAGFHALPSPGSTLQKLNFTSGSGWVQSDGVYKQTIASTLDPVTVYKEVSAGVYKFVECDVEKNATNIVVSANEAFTGYVIAG